MNHNLFESRRNMLRKLAAAGVLGAGGIAGLVRDLLAAGNITPGVTKIRGNVLINGKPAVIGMPVVAGDRIVTGADSEVIFVINEDAFLQRAQSAVNFNLSPADFFRVLSGRLLSVFGKGQPRKLTTATATIGIRGTGCYIEAEDAQTYFCLCYGKAELSPIADPSQAREYWTRQHDSPFFVYPKPGAEAVIPAPYINHTNEELIMLEGLVGRWPTFYAPKPPPPPPTDPYGY